AASGDEHFELHTGDHAICACVFDGGQNQFFPDVTDEGELERLSWRNFDDGSGGAGDPTDDDHDGKLDEVWYVWEPAPPGSLVLVHREDGAVVENGIMIIPTPSTSGDLFGIALDFVGATGDPLCTLDAEGQDNEAFGQLVEELLGAPGEPTPTATSTPTNTPTPTATPEKAAGDVNDDGQVTSVDAALVLQLAAGLVPSLPNEPSGDVDLNGSLTAVDAALILQFVAGLIPGLPV
ncbi:MAG: dockerin type I repeat-containing protein, partial [Dehalococcoidia bacterium]|nr:dockerin type I repeat-containing protein [Dehalococcoidia bacterium]